MKRRIHLYPRQHDFVLSDDRFTAFVAGVGSGKTYGGAVKALTEEARLAELGHRPLGLVVAPTYPMLRDATLRTFEKVFDGVMVGFNKGEMTADTAHGEVLFRSADNPDRLRGPNIHWAWIDEGALCPSQTWDVVIGRLRADGLAGRCWITSTPKGRNWLYQRQDQLMVYKASTEQNPYLDREFVDSLKAAYTGKFAQQELYGEFVGFEGLVYEEFDAGRHVQRHDGPFVRYIVGADEGYTNPAVMLVIGLDADDRAHVCAEFYQRRVLQDEFIERAWELLQEYKPGGYYVDPSAAGLIAAMQARGLPVRKADNDVTQGVQQVKAHLAVAGDGRPRLTVDPSCVNTIAEFESYVWKEGRQGVKDEPEKVNDHAMDALRYALMWRPLTPASMPGVYGPLVDAPQPTKREVAASVHADTELHRRWAKKHFCQQCYDEWQERIDG